MIRSTILPASPPPFSSALLLRAPQDHPDDGGGVSDDARSIGPDDVEPEIDPMDLAPADRPPTEGFKRFYTDRSLGYFYLDNPLRRACIHVQESPYFDNFILLAGDFQHYVIAEGWGTQVRLIPDVFGSNGRPIGASGIYMSTRLGADCVLNSAFRVMNIATTA